MTAAHGGVGATSNEEDEQRAAAYALLGALLSAPPAGDLIDVLRAVPAEAEPEEGPLALAWAELARAAHAATAERLDDEYHDLFIGLGRGELVPYGSWYRTGFMMDRPLARLRQDLDALGLERADAVSETEDHAAALLETMGLLVAESAPSIQSRFFDAHLGPWIDTFFDDLGAARSARFYVAVSRFGRAFMAVEREILSMPA